MARIIVTTLGTLGDLHPMFPVAETLIRRGHAVQFVVPPGLQPRVAHEGFPCLAVDMMPDPAPQVYEGRGGDAKALINKHYTPFLRSAIEVLSKTCAGADVLLSTPHQIATAVVGERLQIPWVTLTVFPGFIPSGYTVPQPHWLPALPTPLGRAVNRLTWSTYRYALRYLADDSIEAALDSLGIPANRKLFAPGGVSPYMCLVLSSPAYSPPLPDWPPEVKVVGFAPWDVPRGWQEPPELEPFLRDGERPIVVTTSTAHDRDAAIFLTVARHALEKVGRRGILLTGTASKSLLGAESHAILPSGVAAWPYLPLSRILPRASMVIHHAGIGTALATIREGLPAVAVPAFFDQLYNAGRVRALGVGRVLNIDHTTIDSLSREILKVSNDPSYRERAQKLAEEIVKEDGAAAASDEIEALIRQRVPAAAPDR